MLKFSHNKRLGPLSPPALSAPNDKIKNMRFPFPQFRHSPSIPISTQRSRLLTCRLAVAYPELYRRVKSAKTAQRG